MKITHIGIWTSDLELMRSFYERYFGGTSGGKYTNPRTGFESYFVGFDGDASVELMHLPDMQFGQGDQTVGIAHIAFSLGTREAVVALTEHLRKEGYTVSGEPRVTGDGYFESVVLDPEGNRIELVA